MHEVGTYASFNKNLPQVLAADWEGTGARKKMLPVERLFAYNLKVDFKGCLHETQIFGRTTHILWRTT
jgi:hypothetical protein